MVENISRRDFLRASLIGSIALASTVTALYSEEGEAGYILDSLGEPRPKAKPSAVLLLSANGETGGGTFISPRHIITAAHLVQNIKLKALGGPDFVDSLKEKKYFDNFLKLVKHPSVDLAILVLDRPQYVIPQAQIAPEFPIIEVSTTVVKTCGIYREEKFAGKKFKFASRDALSQEMPVNSYLVAENRVVEFGDSGSGLYIENTGELLGVVSGGTIDLFRADPKSYYVNLANTGIRMWIDSTIKNS